MTQEDFDVHSLATYLHLTPDQVAKMADRGKLPGRRIGGKWKFSPAEIHHWFEDRIGASDEQQLVEVEKVLDRQSQTPETEQLSLAELIPESNICVPLLARTKNSVIDKLCKNAASNGLIWEADKMADAIRQREELHPTALENGVALLHPRRPQPGNLADSFLGLGVTTTGIPFGGPRGSLTDIFFLIASADESTHLRILARLSRLIQRDEVLSGLRNAEGPGDALRIIESSDEEIS